MGRTLQGEGVRIIGWDLSPRDWENPTAEVLVRRVLDEVRPGSIMLFHDGLDSDEGADREVLLSALPQLIQELQVRGYQFVTVGELLNENPYAGGQIYPGWWRFRLASPVHDPVSVFRPGPAQEAPLAVCHQPLGGLPSNQPPIGHRVRITGPRACSGRA